ncbi:MAG: rodA, partial [Clostridia bacterium]|nr:rodA [Clostridia bacterium]
MAKKKSFFDILAAIKKYIFSIDIFLVLIPLGLTIFGIFMINSATVNSNIWERSMLVQIIALCMGFIAMIIISKIDYDILCELSVVIAVVSCIMLILTAIYADTINGNRNWLNLGFFNLQTSEFTKIAFAITFSTHLTKVGDRLNNAFNILLLCLHFCVYFIPVILQGDIGTALVYIGMFISVLFIAGIYYRYIIIGAVTLISSVPFVWEFLKPYQQKRILFGLQPELDPLNVGYQPLVARMALGSGQMNGLGYGQGIQTQNDLLPASHTDFIYAIIGEEFGFIGNMAVLILIIIIIFILVRNALKAKDKEGYYICIIIAAMIFTQMLINIGMCIGVTPVIGVTLPFLSYGGSSILSLFVALGLIQSIRIKPEKSLKFKINNS